MGKEREKLHIAILGTRGVPARYGGFETFAEELSSRLIERGHSVTVYGRKYPDTAPEELISEFNGVQCRYAKTLRFKYFDTPLSSFTAFWDARRDRSIDVILLCNAANSLAAWLAHRPLVINVDGVERRRSKWGLTGKLGYLLGEMASVLFANAIVADARSIARYYYKRFGTKTENIAYGADPKPLESGSTLEEFGLTPGNYLLYVSRLEPENNALGVIQAYSKLDTNIPLVVVGDAPYAVDYRSKLEEAAQSSEVIFTGYQFGDAYRELRTNCKLYIQATEVGGTHPALVEGMAYGNCIIANGVPEHFEVLGGAGLYYQRNDFEQLSSLLGEILSDDERITEFGLLASQRAQKHYNWERIVDQYEELFYRMGKKLQR